jgi:phospholipid-translocating ATPase
MSIIVKCQQTNDYIVFCKGAENSVLPKCTSGDIQDCNESINEFSKQGWRTLALAYRVIDENEYASLNIELTNAYKDVLQRDNILPRIIEEIESKLTLIGATAVEDRLQDQVPETLEALRQAGIKIWVLTGDKRETAINISESCKHLSPDMFKLDLTYMKDRDTIKINLKNHSKKIIDQEYKSFAYIIDGQTLGLIFKFNLEKIFRNICMRCDAVLCCRMSPAQKAMVVRLVKTSSLRPLTCAIGDGANDVSMIQEADVGLGIFGKEGRNAARSADYAFSKFKHIRRALLVHGYLYYTRLCTLIHFFFYKVGFCSLLFIKLF